MRLNVMRRTRPNTWKGLAAGLAGGLVASWTMNQFQTLLSKASEKISSNGSNGSSGASTSSQESPQNSSSQGGSEESDDATMKIADTLVRTLTGKNLTREQKKKAGPAVHYIFGSLMGGVYGVVSEHVPGTSVAAGVPFGTALFLGADEIAVPIFGLSKSPTEYPLSTHASALASHLVYGVTTEVVRKYVRRGLQEI